MTSRIFRASLVRARDGTAAINRGPGARAVGDAIATRANSRGVDIAR